MLASLRNRNLSARLLQPADELWDWRLGVSTFGHHPGSGAPGEREWYLHYIPSPYRDIFDVLSLAALQEDDTVTDLGCGLGRVVFAASHRGARRAEGVELIPALAGKAQSNRTASRLQNKDIAFFQGNVLDHDLSRTTLIYMFHSFGHQIVAEVLDKARHDRRTVSASRPLRIAYVNPVCDDVIADTGWFRCLGSMPEKRQWLSSALHYRTTLWVSTDC
ncbi:MULTISPECIES: hypothetical protein [unclassified Novosphingobium]|uniref:hypothetical protein n=1 Tax=unclassified Novosphingobium TaxID=2644732 RepID=UPI001359E63E|nr:MULTISPECIES: hypothetical protein [unclassified Novosphingobium]